MNVFALDSSGKTASVAILQDNELLYEGYLANGLTHSETLMPLVQNAFSITALTPQDISLYCVNAGPGSFTGLRIGMAIIKGLAFENNTPCAAVSTPESLAYGCACEGTVIAALNARRGEVYHAAFNVQGGKITRLYDDTASNAAELCEFAEKINGNIWLLGDGAYIVKDALGTKISSTIYAKQNINPRAGAVAACGVQMYEKGMAQSAESLEISYCRLSQAQREREEKLK